MEACDHEACSTLLVQFFGVFIVVFTAKLFTAKLTVMVTERTSALRYHLGWVLCVWAAAFRRLRRF
jgi:hypothetical protein